jgi:hypothetical protein
MLNDKIKKNINLKKEKETHKKIEKTFKTQAKISNS